MKSMYHHTLILSTAKVSVPKGIDISFITNMLNCGLILIEYFGIELDNPADYIDQDMIEFDQKTSLFNFHFDTNESLDYDSFSLTDVEQLIGNVIKKATNIEIRADEKDITVYL